MKAVKKALLHKGLMYRYNSEDDFGLPSSAFTICTFWLIRALFVIGEKEEARCLFDDVLTYSNHLGLFSEDIDFNTKEQLGNFPQAYSHLLFCVQKKIRDWLLSGRNEEGNLINTANGSILYLSFFLSFLIPLNDDTFLFLCIFA